MENNKAGLSETEIRILDDVKAVIKDAGTIIKLNQQGSDVNIHIVSPAAFNRVAELLEAKAGAIATKEKLNINIMLSTSWAPH